MRNFYVAYINTNDETTHQILELDLGEKANAEIFHLKINESRRWGEYGCIEVLSWSLIEE